MISLDNIGLAKALNAGKSNIVWGWICGVIWPRLFIRNNFFNKIILIFQNNSKLAIIDPLVDDEKLEQEGLIYPDTITTLGSLIPISVFEKVGVMDEPLFIDYEWCLRAIEKGIKYVRHLRVKHNGRCTYSLDEKVLS